MWGYHPGGRGRVLVTGGAGFIGSHVAERLVRGGYAVTVLDDLSGGFRDNVPAGARYGFRLSGSNGDFNNFLRGTFTLSNKPFIDATLGHDNRQWFGAETLTPGVTKDGFIEEAGEARWYKFLVTPGQKVTVTMDSPPWYFPEMKRSAYDFADPLGGV